MKYQVNNAQPPNQRHSFIAGGKNNTVSAPCAAILGGEGDTVTHAYAAVFGNGIASQCPDTFHVSCLNAVNTPNLIGIFPSGTIGWKSCSAITLADRVLVMHP